MQTENLRDRFIYIWSVDKIPFYVGRGKHRKSKIRDSVSKYGRAYEDHLLSKGRVKIKAKSQEYFDLAVANGTIPEIHIMYDDLTISEANRIEHLLVELLGRVVNNTGVLQNIVEGGLACPMEDPIIRDRLLTTLRSESHRHKKRIEYYEVVARDPSIIERRRSSLINVHSDPQYNKALRDHRNTPSYRKRLQEVHTKLSGKCVEVGGVKYESIRSASISTGIDRKTISKKSRNGRDAMTNYRKCDTILYNNETYSSRRSLARYLNVNRHVVDRMIVEGSATIIERII